jgi:hypothetical protein
MLLSALPLTASATGDRLLLPVGLGASALCAHAVAWLAAQRMGVLRPAAVLGVAFLCGIHLVQAPLLLPLRVATVGALGDALARADAAIPAGPDVREQTVVVVNAPIDVLLSYAQVARARRGQPRPRHLYWLATASSPLAVTRTSPTTLSARLEAGWLYTAPERHYRAPWLALALNQTVSLGELTATVRELTDDGRPARVEFRLDDALESKRYVFLYYDGKTLSPWRLPAIGEGRRFPAEGLFTLLYGDPARRLLDPDARQPLPDTPFDAMPGRRPEAPGSLYSSEDHALLHL